MYQLRKRADEKKLWEKPAEMPDLLYTLLCARGISSYEEAERFITPALQPLYDPFAIDHMQEAVDIIRKSINAQEKICVYGDYDVDGVCASTILYSALRDLGADVQVYILRIRLASSVERYEEAVTATLHSEVDFAVVGQYDRSHVETVWSHRCESYGVALWHNDRSTHAE